MPKKEGTEQWRKVRRQEYLERKVDRFYIFCEGEKTEPNYFEGFKRSIEQNPIYRNMVLIEIKPCGAETLRVLTQAERYVKENELDKGQVWCVYDKDSFPSAHFNQVVERVNALNKNKTNLQYHAAWSNECIEFWFILHFENYIANNNRKEYKAFLNNQFKENGLQKYEKNLKNIYELLLTYGYPKLAIRHAKKIIEDEYGKPPAEIAPGTKVYELVEALAIYLPEEEKKHFL
jgi:hypothetical protein